MKKHLIHLLGGFTEDEVSNEAVRKLFNNVGPEDILRADGDVWLFRGKPLMTAQVQALRIEAKSILASKTFQILDTELKWHTNKKLREAQTERQLDAAKMIEYTWDVIKTRLKRM